MSDPKPKPKSFTLALSGKEQIATLFLTPFAFLFLWYFLLGGSLGFTSQSPVSEIIQPITRPVVTMAQYEAIQSGMTYEQVSQIIGSAGEEMSRAEMAGFESASYSWQNPDGSNVMAVFSDGALQTKAQFGL
jgi:hypothetical protein